MAILGKIIHKTPVRLLKFVVIIIFFIFLFSPIIPLFLSKKYRDRTYIELTYRVIADKETEFINSKEDVILRFFDYANKHIFVPAGRAPWEANMLDYLVTGVGWCDHQANVFNKLLSKKSMPARYVYLKDKDGISPHTISEVYFNHRWVVFDPQNNLYFKLEDGKYATLNEISQNPLIVFNDIKLKKLMETDKDAYEAFKVLAQRILPLPMEPERSLPWTRKNNIFTRILDLYVAWLGQKFINTYQDIYLKISLFPVKRVDYKLFFIARNYQLYYRKDLAISEYTNLFTNFPNSEYYDDSLFFLGFIVCRYR